MDQMSAVALVQAPLSEHLARLSCALAKQGALLVLVRTYDTPLPDEH